MVRETVAVETLARFAISRMSMDEAADFRFLAEPGDGNAGGF
jgi:hypothetical protein